MKKEEKKWKGGERRFEEGKGEGNWGSREVREKRVRKEDKIKEGKQEIKKRGEEEEQRREN